jgi:hypothetical protein
MKQFKFSALFALVLCVLVGYFEPANATVVKSVMIRAAATNSYVALNSTTNICPFWPNPISPSATLTAISANEVPATASIQLASGGTPYAVSVLAYDQPFPLSTVENNAYFEPALYPYLTGTTLGLPSLPDGIYILTIKTNASKTYTTKITISSK